MRILLAVFILCFAFPIQAQEMPNEWTPEDIINTEYVSSPSFSADNQMVLWSKRKPIKKKDAFVSDLYLTRLNMTKDGAFRTFTLTQGEESNYNALLSKNGEYVYFLSSREKGKKLWRLSLYGGEPEEVHTFENGISSLSWLNEHTLAFVSNDGKTLYEQEAKKRKDNTVVVEDEEHWTASRLYAFDLKKEGY